MGSAQFKVTDPIVVASGGDIHAVDLPSGWLTRLQISGPSGTVDLFSRSFTWAAAVDVRIITSTADNKTIIHADDNLPVAVGDLLTVAGNAVGGYNVATHRVTQKIDAKTVITNQTYTSQGAGGTVTLVIPTAEQKLYRLVDQLTIDTDNVTTLLFGDPAGLDVINVDPLPQGQSAKGRSYIYFKFGTAGTYRIAATVVQLAN